MPGGLISSNKITRTFDNAFAQFGLEFIKQEILESVGLGAVTGATKSRKWMVWSIVDVELRAFVPPFRMLINPENISFNMEKIVKEVPTRGGVVYYHWGNRHDSISANGTTAMFYNRQQTRRGQETENRETENRENKPGGLTNRNVRGRNILGDQAFGPTLGLTRSEGYNDFFKLLRIYRANGIRYDIGPGLNRQSDALGLVNQIGSGEGVLTQIKNQISQTVRNNLPFFSRAYEDYFNTNVAPGQLFPAAAGRVLFYYDGELFWGYFTDLSFTESGEKPFNFTYNFNFNVFQKLGEFRVISDADIGGPGIGFGFVDTLPEEIILSQFGA